MERLARVPQRCSRGSRNSIAGSSKTPPLARSFSSDYTFPLMAKPRSTSASRHVLFTGFPGFIGARLIPRLLELDPGTTFHCLVQEKFLSAADASVAALAEEHPGTKGRIHLVVGDITSPGPRFVAAKAKAPPKNTP